MLYHTPTGYITHQQAISHTNMLYHTPTGYITHQHAISHTNRLYHTPTGYITHQQAISHTNMLYHTPTGYITHQQAISHTNMLYHTPTGYITHQQSISHTNSLYHTPTGYITHQQAISHTNRLYHTPTGYITTITGRYFPLLFSFCLSERNTDFSAGTLQSVWLPATGYTNRSSNAGGGENFCSRPDRPEGPPSPLYNWYRVSIPGVKRPRRGVYHPPSSRVKCNWIEL